MKTDDSLFGQILDACRQALPFLSTVFLSSWGGAVHYLQNMKDHGTSFSWKSLFLDIFISAFVGYLTYLLCQVAGIEGVKSYLAVAVSGHMGPRALASFEVIRDRWLNLAPDKTKGDSK
jgi:hypothetical protein